MARDEAYREAERRIEQARREGATTLDLSGMGLTEVPESIASLTQLTRLDLSHNQLTSIPETIASLTRLTKLYLSRNELTSVPDVITFLTQLEDLDLSRNKLTSIPETISSLTQLEDLDLSRNKLTSIPETISSLTQLFMFNLAFNQLTSLPESITLLSKLNILALLNNPLEAELSAAYEQGLYATFQFLRATTENSIVLNEAKLILIGEGEVGKTSLLGALRGDNWVENRSTTHGVEVDIQSLILIEPDSGKEITFNGWDFGGQNIYRHTHQLFFTSPAIYLAVWNPRRGPEQCRVDEWIKMVKHRAYDETQPHKKPHILVVATHGGPKERLDYIDEQALREEFGNLIVGFYHVDSKTGYGLDELKQAICRTAANIPQIGRTVPTSWKQVLDAIRQRSQTEAWITYEQFQTLCTEQNVDLALAKTYAAILNELGHLIHYSTDPVLKDTVILKPEWLSKAISFVLEDKQVKDQNGLFRHDLLSELWDDPARGTDRYPQNLHPVFLKLMEKFDLSYQVELPESTSLLAQLVPSSRPEGWAQDWHQKPEEKKLTQICRLLDKETGRTVELEGLIYRLIVRLHRYSLGRDDYNKSRHWKNGLLLDDGFNGRAFIEEIAGDVYITVRAVYPSGFLGYLCGDVQSLVKSFWKGIDPRIFLPCPTEQCKGLLDRDLLQKSKIEGNAKIPCSVCFTFHDIDGLMASTATKPTWQEAVTQLIDGQQQILEAVNNGFDSLTVQNRTLLSQADEQYKTLLTTLTDPAKDGPRLFSFEPVDPGFWDKPNWIAQKFRLTLWCEHSCLPLTTLNPKDDLSGVYEIELTREWLKRASPILRLISVTLKLALPIAIPGTQLATNKTEFDIITKQLTFGIKSAESFLQGSEKIGEWLVDQDLTALDQAAEHPRPTIRAQGAVLRELHSLLKEKDPANGFGGLERVQNKRREFLWIHPQFLDKY